MKVCEALVIDRSSSWTECPVCHIVGLARCASPSLLPCGCCKDADKSPSIIAAYADARKARFEYEDAKPKQKIKTSPNSMQQKQEEPIQQKQIEAKRPSPLPNWDADWDDIPLPDGPDKIDDIYQQPVSVSSVHFDSVPLPELPDWDDVLQSPPTLTINEVIDYWERIQKRVTSKKDGVKIAAILRSGYVIIGVEGTQEIPVIVTRAKSDFHYNALMRNSLWRASIEWAMKVELNQECELRLENPQKLKENQFKVNDIVKHHIFGKGFVLKSELEGKTEFVDVQFGDEHGMKRLCMDFAKLDKIGEVF